MLALILVVAAGFRLNGLETWDDDSHQHPDERFLTIVASQVSVPPSIADYFNTSRSSLNPYANGQSNYAYGQLPLAFEPNQGQADPGVAFVAHTSSSTLTLMPTAATLETQAQKDALLPYAGQKMTTGDQAEAFADHYILVHMNAASNGRTYNEVSGEYLKLVKNPNADKAQVAQLGDLRQTLFMGNTLRGLLLNAYAFGTMATIALYGAIASFVGAGILLVLGLLGLRHAKTADDVRVAAVESPRVPQTA